MARVRTNPLQRLHTYLKEAAPQQNMDMAAVLRGVKNPNIQSEYEAASEISPFPPLLKLLTLFTDCEVSVAALGDEFEDIRLSLNSFREALFTAQLNGMWPFSEPAIRKQDMALLKMSADALNNSWSEELIEKIELDSLIAALEDLRERSGVADISPKLKAIILQEIARLIDAIESYPFTGASGLKTAASSAYGLVVIEREEFYASREKPFVREFFTAVGRVADVAAVAEMAHRVGLAAADVLSLLK